MGGAAVSLVRVQGAYYVGSGLWPVLHMRSFEALTGPKTDRWLVRSYGVLTAAIGVVLLSSGRAAGPVSIAAAVGVGAPETWYALVRRRLPWPYIADAVIQGAFILGSGRSLGPICGRNGRDVLSTERLGTA
jgi:hypothetical protein